MKQQLDFRLLGNITEESVANYFRLLRLISEEGKERMKQFVLSNLPDGTSTLDQALQNKRRHFEGLRKNQRYRLISKQQFEELYPPSGIPVAVSKLDTALLYMLARNLAQNKEDVKYQKFENAQMPNEEDYLPQHAIVCIRNNRNILFHIGSPEIDKETFELMWADVAFALKKLGTAEDVLDEYKTKDLDKASTLQHYLALREEMHINIESMYKAEIEKKKYFLFCMAAMLVLLICVAVVTSYVMYQFTGTWKSCMHGIITLQSSLRVAGTISFMPRDKWGAQPPKTPNPPLKQKLKYAIISHSAQSGLCLTTNECCIIAQITQTISFQNHFDDVAFNFLVGNDGVIYEGRKWGTQSATALGWNNISIGIGFMGTFVHQSPSDQALQATQGFLQYLVDKGDLDGNFTLYGLCQVRSKFPDAPGAALYKHIQTWYGLGGWRWRDRPGGPKCDTKPSSTDNNLRFRPAYDHL